MDTDDGAWIERSATALLFNAASYLVSAACLLRIRTPAGHHRQGAGPTAVRAEIAQGAASWPPTRTFGR